jgi:hypothetical protein
LQLKPDPLDGGVVDTEPLGVIAEIAIAITGFTAIAAVLDRRGGGALSHQDRIALRVLVRTSLIALFASFVPELLSELAEEENLIWRWSCAVLGVALLADVSWFVWFQAGYENLARGQRVLMFLAYFFVAVLLGASAGLVGSARLSFLVALLYMLAVALHNFVLLLITGTERESANSPR